MEVSGRDHVPLLPGFGSSEISNESKTQVITVREDELFLRSEGQETLPAWSCGTAND
jgi:hypothetical protein